MTTTEKKRVLSVGVIADRLAALRMSAAADADQAAHEARQRVAVRAAKREKELLELLQTDRDRDIAKAMAWARIEAEGVLPLPLEVDPYPDEMLIDEDPPVDAPGVPHDFAATQPTIPTHLMKPVDLDAGDGFDRQTGKARRVGAERSG